MDVTPEMNLQLSIAPVMTVEMLIRKPVSDVFEAFVNPDITTRFWFTKSSGKLSPGAEVEWSWEMYGVSALVRVKAVEENQRIWIEWGDQGAMTDVEWRFTPQPNGTTYVSISNWGFQGNGDEIVAQALDSKEGFTIVLAGMKALLEHGVSLNLVADKTPDAPDV